MYILGLRYFISFCMKCDACQGQFAIQTFYLLLSEKPALLLHYQVDSSSPKGGKVPGTLLWPSPNMAHSTPFTDPLLRMCIGNGSGGLALFQRGEKRGLPWLRSGLS